MIQFFAPDIADTGVLPESDSQHAVRVLRLKEGDELFVVDGKGHRYRCRLVEPHPKHALVAIEETFDAPLPWSFNLTVAVAPTKNNDRMEWLTEKLTEIGFNRLTPLLCRHSERKDIKTARLEKIAVAAMKQSLKTALPQIDRITPFAEFVAEVKDTDSQLFIAYCDPSTPRRQLFKEIIPGRDAVILIGPEGDFSPEEIKLALDAGFIPVTLGDNRLRTETAALYAATAVQLANT